MSVVDRYARRGVWALPIYAVLLTVSTLTHQPDPQTEFPAYASYVTTDWFLVKHLVASVLGAAIGVAGAVALGLLVVRGRSPHAAVWGVVATIVGNVLIASVFGAASYAQPAIGRAFGRDPAESMRFNEDVYGPPLFATVTVGLLVFIAGAVLLGRAVARSSPRLRFAGIAYAVLLPLFAVSNFLFNVVQPVAAAGLAVATTVIALRVKDIDLAPAR